MAVAKAQYAISEITAMLRAKGITVRVSSVRYSHLLLIDLGCPVCHPSRCWPHARAV